VILEQLCFSIISVPAPSAKTWQVRLAPDEDATVTRLAQTQSISKNDVVRRALRLLAAVERARAQGDRVLVERRDGPKKAAVEIWLI
jgi:hypothetical protein